MFEIFHSFTAQIPSNLPPPATYHDIVIDTVSGSPASTTIDPPYYIPAHLEYHDNEKKWRAGGNPNKDIILKDCFNICRKLDGAGIKDHVIAVVSIKDTLDIIFEKEQDMLIWLELLLSCQQGGRSAQGRIAKPIYENMWEVNVKGFKSDKGSSSKFFQMTGPHRLVATEDAFKFFELGSDEPIPFAYKDIKGHKNHNRNYIIQTGRMTRSGRGEIEIDCKDHHVSAQIYATVCAQFFPFLDILTSNFLFMYVCVYNFPLIFCSLKGSRKKLSRINREKHLLGTMVIFTAG